jgi:hypothetical protein
MEPAPVTVFFFGFFRALAIFFSTPAFLPERAAVFLVALLALFFAAGFLFAGAFAVFFTVVLGVLFFVLLPAADLPVLVEDARLAAAGFADFLVPVAFLVGLFLTDVAFAAVFFLPGLPAVLFFAAAPFFVVVRFLAVVLLFAVGLFFTTLEAFVFFVVAFAFAPVVFELFRPAAEVLFFDAVVLPLAVLEVLLAVAGFFPAALRELLPPLLLPEEVLAFGIVVSLLIHCYSMSVFLLIW